MRLRTSFMALSLVALSGSLALAQSNVRVVQDNGTQYVEATDSVRQPVTNTDVERREETVYREEYVTEIRESQNTYYAPVTEYVWQPRVHGRLNPFRPNTVAYHLVPRTRWEQRVHTVRTPVAVRQLRPETRIVEVPRRQLGFAERQQTTRTVLAPSSGTARIATRPSTGSSVGAPVGGVLQMEGDHPRIGLRPSTQRY